MNYQKNRILLIFCVFLEVLFYALGREMDLKAFNSSCFFIFSLFVALIPLIKVSKENVKKKSQPIIIKPLFLILGCIVVSFTSYDLVSFSLDYKNADMLPVIEIMCQRWIQTEEVYAIIEQFWSGIYPRYLPAMWMPYIPSVYLGIDLRWTGVVFFLIVLYALYRIIRNVNSNKIFFFSLLPLLTFVWVILFKYKIFLIVQEPVVMGFYVLLGVAMIKKNPYFTGIAIALATLSRFGLIIWIVMYVFWLLIFISKKSALKVVCSGIITGGALMFLSSAIFNLDLFFALEGLYKNNLALETYSALQRELGMSKFFSFDNYLTLHLVFKFLLFAIPSICFFCFMKLKNRMNSVFFWNL
jgi:hypothetical protein